MLKQRFRAEGREVLTKTSPLMRQRRVMKTYWDSEQTIAGLAIFRRTGARRRLAGLMTAAECRQPASPRRAESTMEVRVRWGPLRFAWNWSDMLRQSGAAQDSRLGHNVLNRLVDYGEART